jgi:aryl-alcohol dehydrogenase-like predicted oxidoreductase
LTGHYRKVSAFTGANDNRGTIPKYAEFLDQNLRLIDALKQIAEQKGCTVGQVCIAWVAAQGAIPIPGTKQIGRLEENWAANVVHLSDEEQRNIRMISLANKPVGAR